MGKVSLEMLENPLLTRAINLSRLALTRELKEITKNLALIKHRQIQVF